VRSRRPGAETVLKAHAGSLAQGGAIRLMHPRWSDFDSWVAMRQKDRDYLTPWEPDWAQDHLTRAAYRRRLASFKTLVNSGRAYPFHIIRDQPEALIGACNLTHIERGAAQSARLGYWIGQDFTRNGYARAAVDAVARFAFDKLGLHRVEAAVQPENIASIKVLEAVGFQKEGLARGYLKIGGVWADHALYARLARDGSGPTPAI